MDSKTLVNIGEQLMAQVCAGTDGGARGQVQGHFQQGERLRRCDVMITPLDRDKDNAYIIEFKVHKPRKEKSLEETLAMPLHRSRRKNTRQHCWPKALRQIRLGNMASLSEEKNA